MATIHGNKINPDQIVPMGAHLEFTYALNQWEAIGITVGEATCWIEYTQFIEMANEIIRMHEKNAQDTLHH